MPTVFDTLFEGMGFPVLIDQFGETVTYEPLNGTPREIVAWVDRQPPQPFDGIENVSVPPIVVHVYNNATTGIGSEEVNTGGDRILVTRRKDDGNPRSLKINVLQEDHGGVCSLGLE